MRTLITGGAGFIGSHLAEHLLARGDEVRVVDDLSTGRVENVPAGATLVEGSVLDAGLVRSLVADADLVFHLAAAVGVRLVLEAPVETIETNVEGARVVLDAAARAGVRCVFASSSEVYGKSERLPFREGDPLLLGATSEPRWSYACSKAMGEWLALAHAREHGLPVTIVRFFNVVGPKQRGRYGMVLPNLVRQALAGEELTVFGDGSQTRCFLHVDDAVEAVLALAGEERALGGVFNVGGTREISIDALAQLVRRELSSSSRIVHMPYREAYGTSIPDLPRRRPDVTRLRELTGFAPRRTLEDAVRDLAHGLTEPAASASGPGA
jgi:UDP-glucose 4-epimerase